ncbi:hypothetical protein V1277_006671 [Bradyrhizobium sp. AZCC 1588]|uniref:hypothetical protein n=1 Tax=unclassified Bradyrhizobium TaxID=2631580 RepID=UPI002FF12342
MHDKFTDIVNSSTGKFKREFVQSLDIERGAAVEVLRALAGASDAIGERNQGEDLSTRAEARSAARGP